VDDLTRRSIVKDSTPPTEPSVTVGLYLLLPGTEGPYLMPWSVAQKLWSELDAIFGGQE
jgi:hypothetical protein